MARMVTLNPAPTIEIANEISILSPEAGRYSAGLRGTVHIYNGEILYSDIVDLASNGGRRLFAPILMELAGVSEEVALKGLLELAEACEGVVRQVEQAEKRSPRDSRPGTSLDSCLYSPAPSEDPVDGGVLADRIKDIFERHLVLPQGAAGTLSLWTIFTYALDAFDVSPMVFLYSPLPECGKSRVLTLIQYLSYRGLMASSISSAGFFRTIEALTPTICLDEIDTYLRERDELRGVINSGHSRATAHVIRVDGESMEPRAYSTWSAKALAGIGLKSLADAPRSRSIKIEMQKKLPSQKVANLRNKTLEAYQRQIGPMCSRWAQDNLDALCEAMPSLPDTLTDRAADNWEPLAAIAELIGGAWPDLVRQSIEALERPVLDDDDIKVRLLSDLRDIFAEHGSPLASKFIVEELCKIEEAPWSAYGRSKKPITVNQLSGLLRPFGINSNTIRPTHTTTGSGTPKGYKLEDCNPVFSRYLPSRNATTPQSSNGAGNRDFQNATKGMLWRFEKGRIPSNDADCGVVAFQKAPPQEKIDFDASEGWVEEVF